MLTIIYCSTWTGAHKTTPLFDALSFQLNDIGVSHQSSANIDGWPMVPEKRMHSSQGAGQTPVSRLPAKLSHKKRKALRK